MACYEEAKTFVGVLANDNENNRPHSCLPALLKKHRFFVIPGSFDDVVTESDQPRYPMEPDPGIPGNTPTTFWKKKEINKH